MKHFKYSSFTSLDFAQDDFFKAWVINPTEDHIAFWSEWMMQHPEKLKEIEEAKRMISLIQFEDYKNSTTYLGIDWQRIQEKIRKADLEHDEKIDGKSRISKYTVAAGLALVVVSFLVYFFLFPSGRTYKTGFGETSTIVLPDNSKVTLNSNSILKVSGNWDENSTRQVWLDGEAYFSVKHTENHQKFIVHVERLTVEVLGTEFNINTRRGAAKIVLNKGKVKVESAEQEQVVMKPGEMVSYSHHQQKLLKKAVNPSIFSSWKNNLLTFKDTPLAEIATLLEDNYGLEVIIHDKSSASKKFTGTIPSEDYEILIQSIAEVFHLKVIRDKKKVLLQKRH